ncbi:PA domain-containing protein [Luteimonas salinilitoris]|uniref:PA domain-containing protein n=1 Tax=Luteimonas salinilitoris TaxID=3237697 RepID=A0ABV4HQ72_9GAMM
MKHGTLGVALSMALMAAHSNASAQSNIVLVNMDPPDAGLNDPASATPIGGNPGRTLGEQRRIAYQYAMDLWRALLSSDVDVRVQASFTPLECGDRTILGSAGPVSWESDFAGAPIAGVEYPVAMANAVAGEDLVPGSDDINTYFNSELGTEACGGKEWFYGLYGNADNTAGGSNFLNVIMHEIGHGLGVSGRLGSFLGTPFWLGPTGYGALAVSNQFDDTSINDLDSGQRNTALITVGDIVWTGGRANVSTQLIADNRRNLLVTAPETVAGQYEAGFAAFGSPDREAFPSGEIALVLDPDAATSQACEESIAHPEVLQGRIALVDRGECEFGFKALNAQRHGAIAVIIANSDDAVFGDMGPGASGGEVTIPVVSVSSSTGQRLRGEEPVLAQGTVEDPDSFYGMDARGRTRLYTTSQFERGSTFSHVDRDMSPNALMEPSETATLEAHAFIDISLDLYEDLGWPVDRDGTAVLGGCDTGIPVIRDVGFIPGASLMAHQNVCEVAAQGSRAGYQRCMNDHALRLRDNGHISNAEVSQVRRCLAARR